MKQDRNFQRSSSEKFLQKFLFIGLIMAALAILLNACGGGGGGGSTTSGGSSPTINDASSAGTAMGTVNGFGSIVVDGQEYQESAGTQYQTEAFGMPRNMSADAVQLGQQVIVSFDADGNITLVDVAPEVEGTVTSNTSSVTTAGGASVSAISVAGVLVVANTDPTQGPVTTYGGGYTAFSSIQVGDNDEIHGLLRSANGIDYVQATYIAKQPSFTGTRITGIVAAYSATANTFTLGSGANTVTINAAAATLLPTGAALSNGEIVSVWSTGTLSNNTLTANVIRVKNQLGISGETLAVSGEISNYISQSNFVVNGVTVDASAVTLPQDITALANGMVVAVSGTVDSSGTLVATRIRVFKSKDNVTPMVMLQGTISDFVSASNFTVRGVVVDASQNPTFNSGYSAANLQNGAYVNITGTLTNNVVVANAVQFVAMPASAVLDLKATVQSYDASTGMLSLSLSMPGTNQSTNVQVTLPSSVTFKNGTAASLTAGQNIRIHALYDALTNTFNITVITFLPTPPSGHNSSNTILLMGVVTAINPSSGTPTSFVLHGLTINVGSATITGAPGSTGALAVGDLAVVYAQTSAATTPTATMIWVAPPAFP